MESRNKKLLRKLNESIEREGNFNADDRNLLAVIAMLIAIIALVLAFVYARQVFAEDFDAGKMQMECNETHCKVSKKDMQSVKKRYNDAVEELREKANCKTFSNT